jgi:hypothetical protein
LPVASILPIVRVSLLSECPPFAELMVEAKRPLKAQMSAEVAAASSETEASAIRLKYDAAEKAIEHEIDHKPLEMHMSLAVAYNFLSK